VAPGLGLGRAHVGGFGRAHVGGLVCPPDTTYAVSPTVFRVPPGPERGEEGGGRMAEGGW
jgi:hypothetical protein